MAVMGRPRGLRERVWDWCEAGERTSPLGRSVHGAILLLIVLNVVAVVLESVPALRSNHARLFTAFELFSVAVFTAEYLARLWSCTADPRYAHPVMGRLRFMGSAMALVDLAAVLPFYLTFLHVDLRVMRALRLLRLARLGKVGRYTEAAVVLVRVLRAKREEMLVTLSLVGILGVVFASLAYYAETDAQPDRFPDIPHAMWWAFVTITTVGYGDIAPITPLGKVIGVATAVLGILMIALPTGVLGAAFVEELNRKKSAPAPVPKCPHCGREIP